MANSEPHWWQKLFEQGRISIKGDLDIKNPILSRIIHDDQDRIQRITENSEPCTIIFDKDSVFQIKYHCDLDYTYLEKKFPFTCEENSDFHPVVLFDIKSNATLDERIHDAIRGYHFGYKVHILKGLM